MRNGHGRWAALLVAPLLIFLTAIFLVPIGAFLWRAVAEPDVSPVLPGVMAALRHWDGNGLPPDDAFLALSTDLLAARDNDRRTGDGALARAAARLNADVPGLRGALPATARRLSTGPGPASPAEARAAVLAAAPEWSAPEVWAAIRGAGGPVSSRNLLAALDLRRGAHGIESVPDDRAVLRPVLWRTLGVAAAVTAICLLLGYPLAMLIATAAPRAVPWLLGAVLLPFWTSLVVRTAAWWVMLQKEGLVNAALGALGLIGAPESLLFGRFAVLVATVHVLLPFMVLPIAANLRAQDPRLLRAAAACGAGPARAFVRVTLPLSLPGVGAGCLLVFVQALGFFVTPALLGGPGEQMLAWFVFFQASRLGDWGMAAALSVLLLALVLAVVLPAARLLAPRATGGRAA